MGQGGTEERTEAGQPGRALVALDQVRAGTPPRRVTGGRPMAGFLTQVMIGADPALRPARSERTRTAASLYASAEAPMVVGTKPSGVTI